MAYRKGPERPHSKDRGYLLTYEDRDRENKKSERIGDHPNYKPKEGGYFKPGEVRNHTGD